MKLTLRPEWRLWPLASFLGLLDLKTGVTIVLLFALFNKVAGIYGLIAVLTGAGGTFPQISLYLYSAIALVGLVWGLQVVTGEDPKRTFYFAHLFFADHVLSTAWTVFFAVVWWAYTPHDGRRQANSAAQEDMMQDAVKVGSGNMTTTEREQAAMMIWNKEKGTAAAVIVLAWIAKLYFALLLYSYATHLRKGSYRSLPLSRSNAYNPISNPAWDDSPQDVEDEAQDLYHIPLRTPRSAGSDAHHAHASNLDFVSAPGRPRRPKSGSGHILSHKIDTHPQPSKGIVPDRDIEEEVLFDDDELGPRMHSKMGTEESASASSPDDEW